MFTIKPNNNKKEHIKHVSVLTRYTFTNQNKTLITITVDRIIFETNNSCLDTRQNSKTDYRLGRINRKQTMDERTARGTSWPTAMSVLENTFFDKTMVY